MNARPAVHSLEPLRYGEEGRRQAVKPVAGQEGVRDGAVAAQQLPKRHGDD